LNFKSPVAGNRLHINGNRLQLFNSNFKTLLKADFSKLSSDNRLHCLVIDYQSLGCWKQCVLRKKFDQPMRLFEALYFSWSCFLDLELMLKQCLTFECLLKQPCLILLWYHQNPVFIHSQYITITKILLFHNSYNGWFNQDYASNRESVLHWQWSVKGMCNHTHTILVSVEFSNLPFCFIPFYLISCDIFSISMLRFGWFIIL